MKSKTILEIAFLMLVLIAASCKKDDSSNNNSNTESLSFKVDGTVTVCDSAVATLYTNSVTNARMIDVLAFKGGADIIEFHMQPKAGTYAADGTFTNAWITYFPNLTDFYHSTSGSLVLTKCDTVGNVIQGTFNFTGKSISGATKSITEGVMNIYKLKKN